MSARKYFTNYTLVAVVCCVAFAATSLLAIRGVGQNPQYAGSSITFDEVSHIGSGYSYLKHQEYFFNPEHPPLVKDLAALPLLALDLNEPSNFPLQSKIREDGQWGWGSNFLFNAGNPTEKIIMLSRASLVFFNTVLLLTLYGMLSKLVNQRVGLVATALIALSPLTVAHGALVTMDVMSGLLQLIALTAFGLFLKSSDFNLSKPSNYLSAIVAASFISLALLSKFSSILIIPTFFVGGFVYLLLGKKNLKELLNYTIWCVLILIYVGIFVASFYSFHVKSMNSVDMYSQFTTNWPGHLKSVPDEILNWMVHSGDLLKGLAAFINGMLIITGVVDKGTQPVSFFGQTYPNGAGPFYFPVLYFYKLPLIFHFLMASLLVGLVARYKKQKNHFKKNILTFLKTNPLVILLAVYLIAYSVVALKSPLQIGVRHFIGPIFCCSIIIGLLAGRVWRSKVLLGYSGKAITLSSLIIMAGVLGSSFPYYLSYYNIIGGGTENGYKIAVNSNYDWGQDLKRLGAWAQENNIQRIYTALFVNPFVPKQYYLAGENIDIDVVNDPLPPKGSIIAISAHVLVAEGVTKRLQDNKNIVQTGRVGSAILIYQVQ